MTEEWTDWIDHDGRGCPVQPGTVIQAKWLATNSGNRYRAGDSGLTRVLVLREEHTSHPAWDFSNEGKFFDGKKCAGRFVAYRIRKPRALQKLIELAENLPEEVDA